MENDKLACQATCGSYGDLLAQDGPDGKLEAVPPARGTQSGTLRYKGSEDGIAGEMAIDGFDVGTKIEEAAHTGDDRRETADVGEADADRRLCRSGRWVTSMLPIAPSISTVRR